MRKSILAVSTFALTMGAFAQTNTTVTSAKKSTFDKIKENTSLGYFSEYAGPNLQKPSNTEDVSANLWTSIKAKYKINDSTKAFIAHTFTLNQHSETVENEELERYTDEDFRVGVETWGKYNSNISFRNRIRLETPSENAGEVKAHKTARVRISHLATTTIDRLSLTGVATMRKWFYNQSELNDNTEKYELIPTAVAEYAITDSVSAYAEYSQFLDHRPEESLTFLEQGYQELYLGSNISIASGFNLGVFAVLSGSKNSGMKPSENTALSVQLSGAIF
jgi:hypothetical protein